MPAPYMPSPTGYPGEVNWGARGGGRPGWGGGVCDRPAPAAAAPILYATISARMIATAMRMPRTIVRRMSLGYWATKLLGSPEIEQKAGGPSAELFGHLPQVPAVLSLPPSPSCITRRNGPQQERPDGFGYGVSLLCGTQKLINHPFRFHYHTILAIPLASAPSSLRLDSALPH